MEYIKLLRILIIQLLSNKSLIYTNLFKKIIMFYFQYIPNIGSRSKHFNLN